MSGFKYNLNSMPGNREFRYTCVVTLISNWDKVKYGCTKVSSAAVAGAVIRGELAHNGANWIFYNNDLEGSGSPDTKSGYRYSYILSTDYTFQNFGYMEWKVKDTRTTTMEHMPTDKSKRYDAVFTVKEHWDKRKHGGLTCMADGTPAAGTFVKGTLVHDGSNWFFFNEYLCGDTPRWIPDIPKSKYTWRISDDRCLINISEITYIDNGWKLKAPACDKPEPEKTGGLKNDKTMEFLSSLPDFTPVIASLTDGDDDVHCIFARDRNGKFWLMSNDASGTPNPELRRLCGTDYSWSVSSSEDAWDICIDDSEWRLSVSPGKGTGKFDESMEFKAPSASDIHAAVCAAHEIMKSASGLWIIHSSSTPYESAGAVKVQRVPTDVRLTEPLGFLGRKINVRF